jgi:hypothetical protein
MKHPYSYFKQTKMSFFLSRKENRETKQVLSGGMVPVGGGGFKERV